MEMPYRVTDDIDVLPTYFPIPPFGILPVNAFVIQAKEPVLVDTGLVPETDDFMEALRSVIDPQELKWLWLTHTDQDHIGSLHRLLDEVPRLRVVTSYLGVGKMSLFAPLPMERVYLLNPGQRLDVGDRTLTAVRPPSFDAPETTGFWDSKSEIFFSSDCLGALLSSPAQDAADIAPNDLKEGQTLWATIDAPWLCNVDRSSFARALDDVRNMSPRAILSSHLPPAFGMTERLIETLAGACDADPFVGPDQAALEAMVARMTQGSQATPEASGSPATAM